MLLWLSLLFQSLLTVARPTPPRYRVTMVYVPMDLRRLRNDGSRATMCHLWGRVIHAIRRDHDDRQTEDGRRSRTGAVDVVNSFASSFPLQVSSDERSSRHVEVSVWQMPETEAYLEPVEAMLCALNICFN